MKITTVLFDLDGTLLPMDQDRFVMSYFTHLAHKIAPLGYDPEPLFKHLWMGVKAMVMNDGSGTNEEAFWRCFAAIYGDKVQDDKPAFDHFYAHEFQQVAQDCGHTPEAARLIARVKERGFRVALATNPLFPAVATESRIRWAGLSPQDFEHYTTYENAHYCKPNPDYYREVLSVLGCKAEECLMVGNDVGEDMIARDLGMQVFLLTDCLINKADVDIASYPHGSFPELMAFVDTLNT